MKKLFLGILLVMFWLVQTGEAHVTYINGKAVILADQVNVSEDGSIGISATQERFIFDGSGNLIKVTGANFQLLNSGSNQNSYKLMLLANNGGTTQTGSLYTAYGADPYLVIAVPNDAGTETQVLGIHDTVISLMTDNTVDLGSISANRLKNLFLAGYATADSILFDSDNRDVKLYRSAANVLYTPDTLSVAGNAYVSGTTRIMGQSAPTSGAGVEIEYAANSGRVLSYDRTAPAYRELVLQGKNLSLQISSVVGRGLFIDSTGNVLIGTTSLGTSAAKVLGMGSGTAPSTAPVDMAQQWVADYAAGDARWYFMGEGSTNTVIIGNGELRTGAAAVIGTDLTVTDQLIVSGTGPHAIGGAASAGTQLKLYGSFSAAQSYIRGIQLSGNFTGQAGCDFYGFQMFPTFNVAASGIHAKVYGMFLDPPTIVAGGGGVTTAVNLYLSGAPTGASTNLAFWIDAGPTRMDDSLSIGTGARPTALLVLGADNAVKPSTNTWTIASDVRLKKNIVSFKDGLRVLDQIDPIWFEYNGKGNITAKGKQIGVRGQDMQSIAPYTTSLYKARLNKSDREDTELINFNSHALTYVTINAIKELEAITQGQQKQIETLSKQIAVLKKKIGVN